jgi:serine/threonine-protein kinase
MAPERIEQGECDHRVDVYALGCVLYEALTATKAFPVSGAAAKMFAHISTPPPRPSQGRPGVPPALDEVVAVAMAKAPGDRYRTVSDLATSALRALDGRPGTAGPPPSSRFAAPRSAPPRTVTAAAAGPPPAARPPQPASTRISFPGNPGATNVRAPGAPPRQAPPQQPQRAPEPPARSRRALYLALAAVLLVGVVGAVVLLNLPGAGTFTGAGAGTGAGTSTTVGTPLTPSTKAGSAQPPPAAGTTTVTDQYGRKTQLQTESLQVCDADGLTLSSGQSIPTRQISRIEVTEPESQEFAVAITLTNGQPVKGRMAAGCQVTGRNNLGPFTKSLVELQSVEIGR